MSLDPGTPAQHSPGASDPGHAGQPGAIPAQGGPGNPPEPDGGTGIPGATTSPGDQRGRADGRNWADAGNQVGGHFTDKRRLNASALADFNNSQINGSVHNNAFNLSFGQGTAKVRATQIPSGDLNEPFVATSGADRLAELITSCPFVVLHGPRGVGKRAALVWALRRQAREDDMFYLDPSTDWATFSCDGIPDHAVLIVEDVPDGVMDRLDAHVVKRIESELQSGDRRLGITTSRAASGAAHSPGFLVAELDTRPVPRDVFNRHLTRKLLGTGITRDAVLGWPGVGELVDAELGQDCPLRDAAWLARLLSEARNEPDLAAARTRAQMKENADEKVPQWFRKLGSLKSHCMAISLAVLNGQSREVIAHEAGVLEKRFLPAPDAHNAPAFTNPFDQGAMVSPERLDATVTGEARMTEHGPIVIQAMSYREPGYPGKVLRYVWRVHDGERAAIVDWLRYLGTSRDLAVRVRAATATGFLACEALDFLHDQVISWWGRHPDAEVRDCAAIALGPPADDPVLGPTVRSLVDVWAGEASESGLRAAAARAYGRTIGLRSPTSALRALSKLAGVDHLDVVVAAANSYCELVLDGTLALAVRVLGEAAGLAADRAREKQVTGRLTLLGLSAERGAPPVMNEHHDRLRGWPTLLVLALANATIAESAARLWQLGLLDPDIGNMVRESLDDWACAAEESAELRLSFVRFLHWVVADGRTRVTVLRRARTWALPDGAAPETGRSVIGALGG